MKNKNGSDVPNPTREHFPHTILETVDTIHVGKTVEYIS
jgi:hypothetical protein